MKLIHKIILSHKFGRVIYIISGLLNLSASASVVFAPELMPEFIILKALSIPVVLYLFKTLREDTSIYYYINMGISRKEYYEIPVVIDSIIFILLMIITCSIGYAIH